MNEKPTLHLARMTMDDLDSPKARRLICEADAIVGKDKSDGRWVHFFGKDLLNQIVETGQPIDGLRLVEVLFDMSSEDWEKLGVIVYQLKGSTCNRRINEMIQRCLAEQQVQAAGSILPRDVMHDEVLAEMVESCELALVDLSKVKLGEIRHPPFPPEVRAKIAQIHEEVKDVIPRTMEEWEDLFRRDLRPDREIRIWLHLCECYRHFTGGRAVSVDQKRDIFNVIVATSVNSSMAVGETFTCLTLSRKRVREIAAFVEGTWPDDNT